MARLFGTPNDCRPTSENNTHAMAEEKTLETSPMPTTV
jgi:hypothetical protein